MACSSIDQRLDGDAESTHVDRPKGKAPLEGRPGAEGQQLLEPMEAFCKDIIKNAFIEGRSGRTFSCPSKPIHIGSSKMGLRPPSSSNRIFVLELFCEDGTGRSAAV